MTSMRAFPQNKNVRASGPALLYVNVKWCGHCKAARPVMEKVSGVLGSMVPVYDIDADERPDLARALGVNSFPTIIYVDASNNMHNFDDARTVDAITSFVCLHASGNFGFCRRHR